MKRAAILQEIEHLLQKITDQRQFMLHRIDNIQIIELDLMMKNTGELYEKINELRKLTEFQEQPIEIIKPEKINESSLEKASMTAALILEEDNDDMIHELSFSNEATLAEEKMVAEMTAPMEDKRAEIFMESHSSVESELIKSGTHMNIEQDGTVKLKLRPTAELFDEVSTVAASFTGKATLHDKISEGKAERSVATHLQSKSLTDLKKSIGINERFVFVKELFEGNQQLYSKSIDQLNSFLTYDAAHKHLHEELAVPMKWNIESKAFRDLSELIKRRFNS